MSGKTFVNTNVLIYAHDVDVRAQHEVARNVLHHARQRIAGVTIENPFAGIR
jgi:predicted nucleic acid-binding protein